MLIEKIKLLLEERRQIVLDLRPSVADHVRAVGSGLLIGGGLGTVSLGLQKMMAKKPNIPPPPPPPPPTSMEHAKMAMHGFKGAIKDKVMEHPKTAMAAGAASALGAGYGAYKYMKNRKGKKK